MLCLNSAAEISKKIRDWKADGQSIAFVPTMGNLHLGHFSLVERAASLADKVVVSIYVNPMQFGVGEDLSSYPQTLAEDQKALHGLSVDLLFLPNNTVMYADDMAGAASVVVPELSKILCGEVRPSHFAGVTTVVNKLLNIVRPDVVIFGEKDYQQVYIIKKMVKDLFMPVTVLSSPTVRESDGLAMSSRNQYLSSDQRQQAVLVYQVLQSLKVSALAGDDLRQLEALGTERLQAADFRVDYVSFRSESTLLPATTLADEGKDTVLLVAAWLGKTRLIDNIAL